MFCSLRETSTLKKQHRGIARGARATCTVRAEKNGAKFTGKSCKCTPGRTCTLQAEQESNFFRKLGDLDGGSDCLGSFSLCFEGDD